MSSENIVLIDKPAAWTSFDICAKIRSHIRSGYQTRGIKPTKRQLRVGHAGTLDPFATGLVVILLGEATKRAGEFLKLDKTYEALIELGKESSTGDPEGDLTQVSSTQPSQEEVLSALDHFTGEITQTPPAYSAIKINGKRAYKLAREGKSFDVPSRQVTIHNLELIDYKYPFIKIRTHVSSGTYIRTLAEDIGRRLGSGAYCRELRRTSIGNFSVDDALTIETYLETSKQM